MVDVTHLVIDYARGQHRAADRLLPLVYGELRALAGRLLAKERCDHTLDPTALVHEAYLRLVDRDRVDWNGHAHFFAVCATTLRRVLVDHAKSRGAKRRRGGVEHVTLHDSMAVSEGSGIDVLALDEALTKLEGANPRQSRVVELRFFAGLTIEETAHVIGVSSRTVDDDWVVARAWLLREMERGGPPQ